jgi:site-specific DNA recombinase
MYTALYARVSTKNQVEDGTSLDYQIEIGTKKAIEIGVLASEIRIYREEGFSGEDIDRPDMNRLRLDVSKGMVKRVIVTHPDRLSRDMTDKLIVCGEFERHNIELVFVDTEYKNTPEGQLFFNMQSAIAQYELAMIKKRTTRGVISAVRDKKKVMPMRVPPYGYDLVDSQLIVNPQEAEFVKKIYKWYVYDRFTMRQIGENLYNLSALPKRKESKNWSASSIQNILSNEVYIGKYYYNRRKTNKIKGQKTTNGNPKREYTLRDKEDWYEIAVPSIVDQSIFTLAQLQRSKNGEKSGNIKHEYLLRQLIRCGHCGSKWSAYTSSTSQVNKTTGEKKTWYFKRYRCGGKIQRTFGEGSSRKCNANIVSAEFLDDYIWNELLVKNLSNADSLFNRLNENQNDGVSEEIIETYNILKKQLETKESEKERVKVLFKHGVIDEEEMLVDIGKLSKEIKKMQNDISGYEEKIASQKVKEISIDQIKQITNQVQLLIQNGNQVSYEDKRKIVEMLIDEVIISYDEEENLRIVCTGAIDFLISQPSELCTNHQGVTNTTNVVNLTYKTLINIDKSKGEKSLYTVKESSLSLG